MVNIEELLTCDADKLDEISTDMGKDDIPQIIELLMEKNDTIRYRVFLLLQNRSLHNNDVYPFWNVFCERIKSKNSYQRNIGLHLIADNVKWDKDSKFDEVIDEYLLLLHDDKPITVRQCIQALGKIVPYKIHLHNEIANKIMDIKLSDVRETMRKQILLDILGVLIVIRKYQTTDEIEEYITNALTGGLIDKKTINIIESIL